MTEKNGCRRIRFFVYRPVLPLNEPNELANCLRGIDLYRVVGCTMDEKEGRHKTQNDMGEKGGHVNDGKTKMGKTGH